MSPGSQSHDDRKEKNEATNAVVRMPLLFRCLLLVILVLSLLFFASKVMESNRLKQETDRINEEISKKEDTVEELKYLIDSPVDDSYIIRVAREKLGLVFPDEEIFYRDLAP